MCPAPSLLIFVGNPFWTLHRIQNSLDILDTQNIKIYSKWDNESEMIDWERTLIRLPFALRKTGGVTMTSRPYPSCVWWISKSSPLICIVVIVLVDLRQFIQRHTGFVIEYYCLMGPAKTVLSPMTVLCTKGGSGHAIPSIDRHPPL